MDSLKTVASGQPLKSESASTKGRCECIAAVVSRRQFRQMTNLQISTLWSNQDAPGMKELP